AVLLLLVIAVTPESLANAIGQVFQLLGRLVGALAGEAEAGANALFWVVRAVFNPRAKSQQPTTPAAASRPERASGPVAARQLTQIQAQATPAQAAQEEEVPLSWVAETIFTRLLYLATVVVIIASDFVFAILRLQAVLFPSLPVSISD